MSEHLILAAKAPIVAYPALIAAAVINHELPQSPISLHVLDAASTEDGDNVSFNGAKGIKEVMAALQAKHPKLSLNSTNSSFVELAFGPLAGKNFREIAPKLEELDSHLNFRSFLGGNYAAGPDDILIWGALRANGVVAASCKNGTYVNLTRWYKYLEENALFGGAVANFISDLNEVRKSAKVGLKKKSEASYDIDLVDAVDGKVVTRFPPEPSGYLHIGHAKAAILNQYFAQMYHGKLIIRFDDTNPSKEKVEFEESIVYDLELLGIKGDKVTHSSDYFQEMYDLCIKMIKEGKAYCDDTPQEKMREERGEGIASHRRSRTVEENLNIFENEMAKGTEEGLRNCVRAKISVDNKNKALRDPVIYRCNLTPHHRTGSQWKVYPTYDFCCPVVDAIEGVTHALRTIEYRDRNPQYEWMLDAMNLRKVHVWDFSRVNFVRTLLSKRKLQWFVDTGRVSGWDDPRFPTVRGVRRRGMTIEGLRNFIVQQGPSKNILNLDWSLIWNANKKVIDPISPRYTVVYDPVPIEISGAPEDPVTEQRPLHKKNLELGTKPVILFHKVFIDHEDAETLKEGEKVTLMDWNNIIVDKIHKEGDKIVKIDSHLKADNDFKGTEHKLTWLADTKDVTPVELVNFDHLITKDKLEEGDEVIDHLTPETVFTSTGIADLNIRGLKEGDIIQFERKGYFRIDKAWDGKHVVLFNVPDGKVVSRYGAKKA